MQAEIIDCRGPAGLKARQRRVRRRARAAGRAAGAPFDARLAASCRLFPRGSGAIADVPPVRKGAPIASRAGGGRQTGRRVAVVHCVPGHSAQPTAPPRHDVNPLADRCDFLRIICVHADKVRGADPTAGYGGTGIHARRGPSIATRAL